ncbi:unnamed protein product [Prorocentrum cordatum]|uniref:Condensin complex subunit 2 n=1 Tax=Prorocentrum cordatum TaxID=2364126 RepID=A0ABN9TAI4_9DINO|nr:unnamed protein product [Polarella glacialis]
MEMAQGVPVGGSAGSAMVKNCTPGGLQKLMHDATTAGRRGVAGFDDEGGGVDSDELGDSAGSDDEPEESEEEGEEEAEAEEESEEETGGDGSEPQDDSEEARAPARVQRARGDGAHRGDQRAGVRNRASHKAQAPPALPALLKTPPTKSAVSSRSEGSLGKRGRGSAASAAPSERRRIRGKTATIDDGRAREGDDATFVQQLKEFDERDPRLQLSGADVKDACKPAVFIGYKRLLAAVLEGHLEKFTLGANDEGRHRGHDVPLRLAGRRLGGAAPRYT